ncbi:ABC-type Fe3+-hydroxamate transport system, periplasmic component [Rubellimicrobium thermophilum DSM 16684]|uniref:ABC-type Fe3+-hydroxamate transport system, periplasmic component n=1 Tax=Rubellimicrobium thermophilum DSM 16684 TaxID=1123069 RepID=S9RXK2_9RHOB|nr:ABC transporter substrate-binding protein [Rubellimicrobium thermophilum]EPX82760.1 ABC-type Fe3+-hydroxamate transport system, periplasmic component [Rubellimicrobium thermophilum DSM 16684]
MSRSLTAVLALVAAVPALAQDFPLTLETKFGPVTIEERPERVATLDYGGADNLLALGIQPLTARSWFGPYEDGFWPWARPLVQSEPVMIGDPIDIEAVAATDPDVILAFHSGITQEDFDRLSTIAPVVAAPPGRGDYELDWKGRAERAALATGREAEAAERIAAIEAQIAALRAANPEWEGRTFTMLTIWEGSIGLYTASDPTVQLLAQLGLVPHPKVVELSPPGEFYQQISEEILPELDADLVVWYEAPDDPEVMALAGRQGMRAPAEGREIFLAIDNEVNGALSYGSLLSLPYALERLAPVIDAAIDGDPATPVPLE